MSLITPPEVTNTGPGFNRGSGGGARGRGFEERVGVHARTGGIHFAHFTTERPLVVKNRGTKLFRNFPISDLPGLFVQGCEQPRLERDRSQMVSYKPGGGVHFL